MSDNSTSSKSHSSAAGRRMPARLTTLPHASPASSPQPAGAPGAQKQKIAGPGANRVIFDRLPLFVELFADGTGQGKTLGTNRFRQHFQLAGIPTALVRIETERARQRDLLPGDLFIPTEALAHAADTVAGAAGWLAPLFEILERTKAGVVIVDWPGGQGTVRSEIFAASRFDENLQQLGFTGVSVIVTTNQDERMDQAAATLTMNKDIAPGLHQILLKNERLGKFSFAAGSPAAAAHQRLLGAPAEETLVFPAIAGRSWQSCDNLGLSMPAVMRLNPGELAELTKQNRFVTSACLTEIAFWWQVTGKQLDRLFPFRPEPAK